MNESLAKQYFDEGWTFTIDRAYEFWGPILEICHLTEQYFHLIASGNLFITPPNAQGFSLHFDGSSVFSLQLEGIYNVFERSLSRFDGAPPFPPTLG